MKRLDNVMRVSHNLPTLDYDLTAVNGILSVTLKRYNADIDGYNIIDTYYYNINKVNEQFLKSERFSINVIPKILEFIKN